MANNFFMQPSLKTTAGGPNWQLLIFCVWLIHEVESEEE